MGIHSEPFKGVVITGDDIKRFERQVKRQVPTEAAVATVIRGVGMIEEFTQTGVVKIRTRVRA